MDEATRIKMVKAMDFICRHLNNESDVQCWLINGVADGDIERGDLSVAWEDNNPMWDYIEDDDDFADLMDTFLMCMRLSQRRKSTLVCDGVVSKSCYEEDA